MKTAIFALMLGLTANLAFADVPAPQITCGPCLGFPDDASSYKEQCTSVAFNGTVRQFSQACSGGSGTFSGGGSSGGGIPAPQISCGPCLGFPDDPSSYKEQCTAVTFNGSVRQYSQACSGSSGSGGGGNGGGGGSSSSCDDTQTYLLKSVRLWNAETTTATIPGATIGGQTVTATVSGTIFAGDTGVITLPGGGTPAGENYEALVISYCGRSLPAGPRVFQSHDITLTLPAGPATVATHVSYVVEERSCGTFRDSIKKILECSKTAVDVLPPPPAGCPLANGRYTITNSPTSEMRDDAKQISNVACVDVNGQILVKSFVVTDLATWSATYGESWVQVCGADGRCQSQNPGRVSFHYDLRSPNAVTMSSDSGYSYSLNKPL